MVNNVERFSDRVANYVRYRPGYPPEMMEFFARELGVTANSIVADIGSGTGISSKPFLEAGCTVYGVEPNSTMREAAEVFLADFPNFRSVDGTSDATTLPEGSVDLVIAAQAFHWFDPDTTRGEFKRILRPGSYVALIWNERQLDSTEFLRGYEQLLLKYARDYKEVRHEKVNAAALSEFFRTPFEQESFPNHQDFDLAGITGRMLSSSYMPNAGDPASVPMMKELGSLFAKHAERGRIKVFYDTNIFYCTL